MVIMILLGRNNELYCSLYYSAPIIGIFLKNDTVREIIWFNCFFRKQHRPMPFLDLSTHRSRPHRFNFLLFLSSAFIRLNVLPP